MAVAAPRIYASNLTIGLLRVSGEVDDHGEAVRHKSPSDGGTDATGCACNDRGSRTPEFREYDRQPQLRYGQHQRQSSCRSTSDEQRNIRCAKPIPSSPRNGLLDQRRSGACDEWPRALANLIDSGHTIPTILITAYPNDADRHRAWTMELPATSASLLMKRV
jgi:hypothetical protein